MSIDNNFPTAADKMKRKIEETNETAEKAKATPAGTDKSFSFTDLGLDPRLVQAVAEQKFSQPTLVQRMAIPVALKGQDVLCKAKTGSGKTAAYVLPVLAGILKRKIVRRFILRCLAGVPMLIS